MKKYILITGLASLLLISLPGCDLEETPYSSIFTDQFYKTAQDAEAAIAAVYDQHANLYAGPATLLASDFSADQIYPRAVVGRNTLTLFNYDPNYTTQKSFSRTNESPLYIWQAAYAGIEKANWVLEKVPGVVMAEDRKKEILGEAYFLRAYFNWMLTKNFGDIVIKTKASTSISESIVGKSAKADVYKQIYADLNQAEANLNFYSAALVKGRPSKEVAQALYAKAALYNEDWALALQKAQAVLASGKYSLMPEIKDVFNVAKEDQARQENMWAFESESTNPGRTSQLGSLYGPKNSESPEYGKSSFGSAFVYPFFYNSFAENDKRKELMATSYTKANGQVVLQKDITPITPLGILVKKFQDPNSVGGLYAVNIPIIRLADVYLIAAEAEARVNGPTTLAYSFINAVRDRAGLDDLTSGLGRETFIDAVLQERSWELFGEGDRWYDLTRTGKFLTVIPAAVNDVFPIRTPMAKHKYFPIPLDEINANPKLEQAPEWK
ncbi:RagB/SusD family nutrient uptake outer membrane protein [Adhaeribacter rhizoryzae]|uniref:RagB/SusD family nutrient uptake outer membrane protein n=1 Tax=Adhaeribacter rhizoryzae TaxID=2607907 RepID=A0A5M6CWT8_9BACT|nr:RagB/SusD family nutrient uptake outer membrane protein [Adhaeribacter rhizoryzae]KAA5539681.1 RagB/SusD family nutrient uptake outer membrane protein [Adhaeribacter rhizoryzae]